MGQHVKDGTGNEDNGNEGHSTNRIQADTERCETPNVIFLTGYLTPLNPLSICPSGRQSHQVVFTPIV